MSTSDLHECPLCRSQSLTRHCANAGCIWLKCQKTDCDATLDNKTGIGHYKDPKGIIDLKTKAVVRLRLIFRGGVWVDRDPR